MTSKALRQHIADLAAISALHDHTDNDDRLTSAQRNYRPDEAPPYAGVALTARELNLIDRHAH